MRRITVEENKDCNTCNDGSCSAHSRQPDENEKSFQERQKIANKMCRIDKKFLVLSGKGGVGKSTVAVNLAFSLAAKGKKVGLMDIDVHGPSVPKMLNLNNSAAVIENNAITPVKFNENLEVISIGFFLRDMDDAIIWRGPLKISLIKQFLSDVDWGELDYLIIDSPPGTGDEPLTIGQLIRDLSGVIIVTTPQDVALVDVRKSVTFCKKMGAHITGVIENMSGLKCPHCSKNIDLFKSHGGEKMADDMNIPFLGSIPIDNQIVDTGDKGIPFMKNNYEGEAGKAFGNIVEKILGDGIEGK